MTARWAYHEPQGNPCGICGLTRARHRVRHEPGCDCGASHKGARSPSDSRKRARPIVGVDGEGIGRNPHRYTLLAYSDESGRRTDYLEDMGGLDTLRCLRFLADIPANCIPYGYYLGYDWTKILADLPNECIYRLFRPGLRARPKVEGGGFSPVCWEGWELHWMGGMVRLRPRGRPRWTTVWDVGRFFQTAFVKALASAGIDSGNIGEMKLARDSFSAEDQVAVRTYCLLECQRLAELVRQLNESHEQAGIPLKNWYGPGSAASVLLNQMNIGEVRGETPEEMAVPIAQAFFGGRFEHSAPAGIIPGPVFSADIVSAYPAEAIRLPCLQHASWRYTTRAADLDAAEQACVRWRLEGGHPTRAWGPLPVRLGDGTIVYPHSGASGWAWLAEFRAAARWPQTRFEGAWVLERSCDCVPFAGVQRAFDTRIAVGKKTAVGGALKRAINSVYGKLAQSVGDPPFRSLVWAGMITSGCRAKLAELLYRYDGDIVAVATDGVYATTPLNVEVGDSLGEWEVDEHPHIVLVRPGIYWTDDAVKSRGLPQSSILKEKDAILAALRAGEVECQLPPITQFGGASATVYLTPDGYRRSERYGEWVQRPAKVSFRAEPKRPSNWGLWELPDVESEPYTGRESADALRMRVARMLGEYQL